MSFPEFSECPNCGNTRGGADIFECDSCGKLYCFEGLFGNGCGNTGDRKCPICGSEEGWSKAGEIVEEDEGSDDD